MDAALNIISEKLPDYDIDKNMKYTKHGDFCPYEEVGISDEFKFENDVDLDMGGAE